MASPAIVTESLQRWYGSELALAGVSLGVNQAEVYGFLGPNGAGKTTLVRILCTLLRPSAGRAFVCGHDVVHHPKAVRLAAGVALQSVSLDPMQTGRQLLELQARLYGLRGREVTERVDEVLGLVDIAGAIDRRIATYSGGMERRLDLAAALVHRPAVLFLDEPTTGLDPVSRTAVWEEIRRLRAERGVTIFLTTQYLEEADVLCDRVGIIAAGRLVAEGEPAELKRQFSDDTIEVSAGEIPSATLTRLKELPGVLSVEKHDGRAVVKVRNGAELVSPIAVVLAEDGCVVNSLTLREPTLEDVFMGLAGGRSST